MKPVQIKKRYTYIYMEEERLTNQTIILTNYFNQSNYL